MIVGYVRIVEGPEAFNGVLVGDEQAFLVRTGHAVDEECEILNESVVGYVLDRLSQLDDLRRTLVGLDEQSSDGLLREAGVVAYVGHY